MARTPSMTPQEAESILGPRGHLQVNSENRATVRKWLVANNFPALFVAGLSMKELALAYNQTDGAGIDSLRRKLAEAGDAADAPPAAPAAPAMAAPAGDAATLLRNLLLEGWTPGLDENRVRSIVQESIAGIAPRVIEIRSPDRDPIKLDGIVHPEFERCLDYLSRPGANGYKANVMLVGPAGCGKTYLMSQLAKALGVDCGIVGGSAGATEGDIIGRLLPGAGGAFDYVPSQFVSYYERGNALLGLDEADAFDSNMVMVANMPLSNHSMYVHIRRDNPEVHRGENVYFMATANTYGTGANPIYAGRNQLDGATLDRFIIVSVDYDKRLEESIAAAGGLTAAETAGIWELRDRCREAQVRRIIGTRAFQKASVMKARGESWREIRDRLLEGWSKDEKAKVGV
jgi:hypothetical protein